MGRMFSSASAIFWMYNDSWPVTNGWTIVDYCLRRKLAYFAVRRAFAPVTVIAVDEAENVTIYGVNDTPVPWEGRLRYGLFRLEGGLPLDEGMDVTIPANASTPLASIPTPRWEQLGKRSSGAFALLLHNDLIVAQHRLFVERFKDLALVDPAIHLSQDGETLRLSSDRFAWGVCLDVDGEKPLADNCFDLLPGIEYALPLQGSLGEAKIVRTGNGLFSR